MNFRYKHIIIFVFIIVLGGLKLFGQVLPLEPSERFTVSTDRDLYIAGEQLWYRANNVIWQEKKLLSSVLYVELYDRNLNPIVREKQKLNDGLGAGSFTIPRDLKTDYYFLRVYTQLLRNYPPEFYPPIKIMVVNPEIPLPNNAPRNKELKVIIDQNQLIGNRQNEVIIYKPDLLDKISRAFICNRQGDTTDLELIDQAQIFSFYFEPKPGMKYILTVEKSSGELFRKTLPVVLPSGFDVDYVNKKGIFKIKFTASEKHFKLLREKQFTIAFISKQTGVLKEHHFKLQNRLHEELISLEPVNPGIYFYQISDQDRNIYQTSAFLSQPNAEVDFTISTDKLSYNQGEQVKLTIQSSDAPKGFYYSISIVKKGSAVDHAFQFRQMISQADYINIENIYNLPKNLQKPALINFVNENHDLIVNMFDQMPGSALLKFIPETRAISLSGQVLDKNTNQPFGDVPVLLSEIDDFSRIHLSRTKSNGSFSFPLFGNYGEQNLFLCTLEKDNVKREIKIYADFSSDYLPVNSGYPTLDTSHKELLSSLYLNHQLTGITGKDVEPEKVENLDSIFGFVDPNIITRMDDYIDLPDMETVFNEIVPFVRVKKRKGEFILSVYDDEMQIEYQKPLILIDDIPITDVDKLLQIAPSIIDEIRVINRIYYLGDFLLQGVVMIHTKEGNFAGISMPDDAVFIDYKALDSPTTFKPVSEDEEAFRNVLYWEPNCNFINGASEFSFFASEHISEYEVIVKGFTQSGHCIEKRSTISVEKNKTATGKQ